MAELGAFYLVRLPADVQVELERHAGSHVREDPCVGSYRRRGLGCPNITFSLARL